MIFRFKGVGARNNRCGWKRLSMYGLETVSRTECSWGDDIERDMHRWREEINVFSK